MTGKWIAEGRVAIYLVKNVLEATGDEDAIERVANTTPIPEQAHDIVEIVERSGFRADKQVVYWDVWKGLYDEVLNEKTSWGKEELKKRMDKLLIEEMEKCL